MNDLMYEKMIHFFNGAKQNQIPLYLRPIYDDGAHGLFTSKRRHGANCHDGPHGHGNDGTLGGHNGTFLDDGTDDYGGWRL